MIIFSVEKDLRRREPLPPLPPDVVEVGAVAGPLYWPPFSRVLAAADGAGRFFGGFAGFAGDAVVLVRPSSRLCPVLRSERVLWAKDRAPSGSRSQSFVMESRFVTKSFPSSSLWNWWKGLETSADWRSIIMMNNHKDLQTRFVIQ